MSHALFILKMWVIFQASFSLFDSFLLLDFQLRLFPKIFACVFGKVQRLKPFCCISHFVALGLFEPRKHFFVPILMKSWSSFSWGISHSEEHEFLSMFDHVLIQHPKVSSRISSSLAHQSRPTDLRALLVGAPRILAPTSTRPPPDYYHYLLPQLPPILADHTASRLPLTVDYYHASTNTNRSPPKITATRSSPTPTNL